MITGTRPLTNLNQGDSVLLFPSFGYLSADGRSWRIFVSGAVIEPGLVRVHKKLLLRLLQRVLKADPEQLCSDVFQQRISAFAAATESGKSIALRVGSRVYRLRKRTRRNGHFRGTLRVPIDEMRRLQENGQIQQGWLRFEAVTPRDDGRKFQGRAYLMKRTGLSVISDIDDTIKYTEVTSRRALLENTFLHDFQPISGMADIYRHWSREGASFHYVSSSPWQLFEPLADLIQVEGFPPGSIHLRNFRLRDHMLRRVLLIRRRGKGAVIRSIIESFPYRRFVLVGDSGERDPEIYGALARRYPRQVDSIVIRQLPARPLAGERLERSFRRISSEKLTLFGNPSELARC